ncbi:LysR family transcriptional regulator [Citrobacter freundii]|nr:LysR family transcriptional regulator [Citrobacter freundii]
MNFLLTKRLKYFIISMETKNIGLAAEQLYITRSPLLRMIQELEERMDAKLFIRKYNELIPTTFGKELYEKVKPFYDILYNIEAELSNSESNNKFELLFDISVPFIVYTYFVSAFKLLNHPVICRRMCITNSEIFHLKTKLATGLFSFREIKTPDDIYFHDCGMEQLYLLLPENISERDLGNFEKMQNMRLYIRQDDFSIEVRQFISEIIKDFASYLTITETRCDMASIMLSISAGEGAIILPGHLISYFSPPKTRKILIPHTKLRTGFYFNRNYKNSKLKDTITKVLKSYKEMSV